MLDVLPEKFHECGFPDHRSVPWLQQNSTVIPQFNQGVNVALQRSIDIRLMEFLDTDWNGHIVRFSTPPCPDYLLLQWLKELKYVPGIVLYQELPNAKCSIVARLGNKLRPSALQFRSQSIHIADQKSDLEKALQAVAVLDFRDAFPHCVKGSCSLVFNQLNCVSVEFQEDDFKLMLGKN